MNKLGQKISIVMVAYNEADRIEKVLKEYYNDVFQYCPEGSEFIVYLDGPTDNTAEIANNLAVELKLKVIDCKENKGYFQAAKTALSKAANPLIFFSDSSGKHQSKDFWQLIKKVDNCDIVTGLRTDRQDPPHRRLMTIFGRLFISVLFFIPLYDFNTGFKLIKKKVLDDILDDCHILPITFSNELMIRAYKKGYKICNQKVSFSHRGTKDNLFTIKKLPKIIIRELKALIALRLDILNKK